MTSLIEIRKEIEKEIELTEKEITQLERELDDNMKSNFDSVLHLELNSQYDILNEVLKEKKAKLELLNKIEPLVIEKKKVLDVLLEIRGEISITKRLTPEAIWGGEYVLRRIDEELKKELGVEE